MRIRGYSIKQLEFVARYSRQFNNFNDELIRGIRQKERMELMIDDIYKEICKFVPKNIKYLGFRADDRKHSFNTVNEGEDKKKRRSGNERIINIYPTYARLYIYMFKISVLNQQTEEMDSLYLEVPIYIPLYYDDYHFMIRGNLYSTPLQITDSIFYTNRSNIVVLKNMARAIKCTREKRNTLLSDIYGNKFSVQTFNVYLSKVKIPFLLYYFAYFGFVNTFMYFGADQFCKFHDTIPLEEDKTNYYFKFGQIYISVDREAFNTKYLLRQFLATTLEVGKKNMDIEEITSTDRWKSILGSYISDNNVYQKGIDLLKTFIVSLDHRNIQLMKMLLPNPDKDPKKSMFAVIRYIFVNFGTLSTKTNSLLNKRIRLSEYLVNPIIQSIYKKLHRFLSTPKKNQDLQRCGDIIKVPASILINAVSGKAKDDLAIDIVKFSSNCNDNSLLNAALSYTNNGPGSPGSKSGGLGGSSQKGIDLSHVGRLDINCSSNSSPGSAGSLCPTCKININTLTFQ
jgi:hypothetical protein